MTQPDPVVLLLAVSRARAAIQAGTGPEEASAEAAARFGVSRGAVALRVHQAETGCERARSELLDEKEQKQRGRK